MSLDRRRKGRVEEGININRRMENHVRLATDRFEFSLETIEGKKIHEIAARNVGMRSDTDKTVSPGQRRQYS